MFFPYFFLYHKVSPAYVLQETKTRAFYAGICLLCNIDSILKNISKELSRCARFIREITPLRLVIYERPTLFFPNSNRTENLIVHTSYLHFDFSNDSVWRNRLKFIAHALGSVHLHMDLLSFLSRQFDLVMQTKRTNDFFKWMTLYVLPSALSLCTYCIRSALQGNRPEQSV